VEHAYIEQRDGGYWIKGTRISLDSIVYEFNDGAAPESIRRSFPLLSLEQVYGAIAFYLSHEQDIDAYLAQSEIELEQKTEQMNAQARADNPELFERLDKARREREATLK
jgi:uncharacterized protein (DUF433 family)